MKTLSTIKNQALIVLVLFYQPHFIKANPGSPVPAQDTMSSETSSYLIFSGIFLLGILASIVYKMAESKQEKKVSKKREQRFVKHTLLMEKKTRQKRTAILN